MYLRDIKAGESYASCDGQLVKPVAPVSPKWTAVPVLDENGREKLDNRGRTKTEFAIAEPHKEDPWAKCSTRRPNGPKRGLLVEVFETDEDGNEGKSLGRMLLSTKDVGGTWSEYLLLHSEKVRAAALKKKAREEARDAMKALNEQIETLDLPFPKPGSSGERGLRYSGINDGTVETRISEYMIDPSGTYGSDNLVPVVGLNIHARGPENIAYLLEVLRLGVSHQKSLAKRRERDNARKQAQAAAQPAESDS